MHSLFKTGKTESVRETYKLDNKRAYGTTQMAECSAKWLLSYAISIKGYFIMDLNALLYADKYGKLTPEDQSP